MENKITGTIGGAVLTGKVTNAITIRGDVKHTYISNSGGSGGYIMENARIHDNHIETVTSEILLAIIDNAIFEEV